MSSHGSVTRWLLALKDGDQAAAQPLWERYHIRLISLARQRLQSAQRREADEDDVVQNAFHSFFRGVANGRFPELHDRDNLWRLLVVITARKVLDQLQRERTRQPANGTLHDPARMFLSEGDESALEQIMGSEPTPEFAVQVAEQYQRLLDLLGEDSLRRVAVWKMEGYTRDEMAAMLACSRRTVARKLETIRLIWEQES
jgi:RNA polymerase sigma factor (sigma-70 family)